MKAGLYIDKSNHTLIYWFDDPDWHFYDFQQKLVLKTSTFNETLLMPFASPNDQIADLVRQTIKVWENHNHQREWLNRAIEGMKDLSIGQMNLFSE